MGDYSAIRQKLAAIEHERWADWQSWCHQVLRDQVPTSDELEIVLQRWDKQIATAYSQLSESERASDMEQVDRYWPLIEELIAKAEVAGRVNAQDSHIGRLEVLRAWAENHKPVFQEGERAMAFTIFEIDNEIRIVKKWQDELKAQGDNRE